MKQGAEHYIITAPDIRLRQYWPRATFSVSQDTLKWMLDISKEGAHNGRSLAGLSSVQVLKRGRVVTVRSFAEWLGFINPVVVKRSYLHHPGLEGCFSLPGTLVNVSRPDSVTIRHRVETGPALLTLRGTEARFAMHEIDHLNGILITDYIVQQAA